MSERRGDEFERFVGANTADLLRTAYLIAWDLPTAEDLVQECLFKIARQWQRVRSMEYPAAHTRRVLVNLALSGTRRHGRHRAELEQDAGPARDWEDRSVNASFAATEMAADLSVALGALTSRQRVVLVLRYFEDLSEAQVAEALGCSIGNVKSTASRAIEQLRRRGGIDPDSFRTKGVHAHEPVRD